MQDVLDILYQDQYLVAVNKPSGLLVHRSPIDKHETRFAIQTLRNQLDRWVYPLHRLDKPTSGVLLFAFSGEIASKVSETWASEVNKRYLALVRGWFTQAITVDHALTEIHDKYAAKGKAREPREQLAVTTFRPIATAELDVAIDKYPKTRYSLVECQPVTGRKHQIRRHLKHLSHPIIGDAKYGKGIHNRYFAEHLEAGRLLLHAYSIVLSHPISQKRLEITAPPDPTMNQLFNHFNWPTEFNFNVGRDSATR